MGILEQNSVRHDYGVHAKEQTFNQHFKTVVYPRNFFRKGVQKFQLKTEDREKGDLGQGFWRRL